MAKFFCTEEIEAAYERYNNNETISSISKSFGVSESCLRNNFMKQGMLLRKSKYYKGKVTPENSTAELLKKRRKLKYAKLCGNCINCSPNCTEKEPCISCYFDKNKPSFKQRKIRY